MTVLSIDSGDLNVVRAYAQTGFITDATTNPLFVSQAGLRGEGEYLEFVNEAVSYAKANASSMSDDEVVNLAIDKLSVNLGLALMDIIDGNVSTEVDIRLSFDADASVERARRLIKLYEEAGCANAKGRVLVKLAGTWEGIQAARVLEAEGIRTNITLVFSEAQAKAAGDAKAHLISPFPGRVLEWSKAEYNVDAYTQDEDPGVVMVRNAQTFYNAHAMNTINMPASWRSSTGTEPLDQILALAGVDRMTIPPPLLESLASTTADLPRRVETSRSSTPAGSRTSMSEREFRYAMCVDGAANDKLAAGIRSFIGDTEKLTGVIEAQVG
ncbi:transaldolase [Pseudoscourfieldia marina]